MFSIINAFLVFSCFLNAHLCYLQYFQDAAQLKLLVHVIAVAHFEIIDITFDGDFMINTIHF